MARNTKINGQLEIHHDRGVVYFHSDQGICVLRICGLPAIPSVGEHGEVRQIDITHMYGTDWGPITQNESDDPRGLGYAREKILSRSIK